MPTDDELLQAVRALADAKRRYRDATSAQEQAVQREVEAKYAALDAEAKLMQLIHAVARADVPPPQSQPAKPPIRPEESSQRKNDLTALFWRLL